MLSKQQEYRLAAIIDTLTAEKEETTGFILDIDTTLWIAKRLKENQEELKRYKTKESHLRGFNSIVTVRIEEIVHVVAIWDKNTYVCIFCNTECDTRQLATTHGTKHIRKITGTSELD